ncbi:MAG: glycyl radical protein [Synergistales bacterium]|nr:glycyl radical protein [Synergistales bacterium]
MTPRVEKLRTESLNTKPSVSIERALLVTEFYRENAGKYSAPVMRAMNFKNLWEKQAIYIGEGELIVGERGPRPKAVSTFPELNLHTAEDLRILNSRPMTSYDVDPSDIDVYEREVVPYWRGRTMRDRIFRVVPEEWEKAYSAGMFTEFMEQRAAGHTTLDGRIYEKGMLDFQEEIRESLSRLDYLNDPEAIDKEEELKAMLISCEAAIIFANRHADLAEQMAEEEKDPGRKEELLKIAEVCRWVPTHAPRDLHEALQMYWFVHLGTITELNGWDAMNPGHLDQHMGPFYDKGIEDGSMTRDKARELLECFLIKFNNQPAPPKVGVTAQESGTYNDFTNINLAGLTRDGRSGVNEVSYILLEAFDEIHLLQPQVNIQVSQVTQDHFLKKASEVIRKGYGYPSVFNADAVVAEQVRAGKTVEDARGGGCSGCIETGCFGKEAYILTGYLNVPKIFELAMNNGIDPLTGEQIGLRTGELDSFTSFEDLYDAFEKQLEYIVDVKIRVNNIIEKMYGKEVPATFLSVVIQDCIKNGKDYYNGGPRYNTNYIQCCGIGTITDSLSAIKKHVFEEGKFSLPELNGYLLSNFEGKEYVRQYLFNHTPFYGNDDDYADSIMQRVFASLNTTIEGKPNTKGSQYYLNMLSTTCHIYFGKKLGASANGRLAGMPESDGTSPEHGADRNGPTAVVKSLGKMDQVKTGGTLLNQKFLPSVLQGDEGIRKFMNLIRTYFKFNGHHVQFNVVGADTLRDAQANPQNYRDLLVRVAGYSDYFVDLDRDHQEEIIARSEQMQF